MADLPLDPPPASLVDAGRYNFGTYSGPIARVNPLDLTSRAPRMLRNLRLKEWQAFQLGNDEWFVLGAVYSTKVLALVQVIAVHKETATLHRWEAKVAPTRVQVAQGLDGTESRGSSKGFTISITNSTAEGTIAVRASHRGSSTVPEMELSAVGRCSPEEAGHLVICHPFADDRMLYSDKSMMPMTGSIRMGALAVPFDDASSFMIVDDHKGEYPAPMAYDWVTAAKRGESGAVVGFNLTDNQVRDPERYNENAIFVGNVVHRLPAIHIERPTGEYGPWRVRDADGQVDVTFTPVVRNEMHVGPRRILAEYFGPFGWFDGTLVTQDGESISVDAMFGMGEKKRIRF